MLQETFEPSKPDPERTGDRLANIQQGMETDFSKVFTGPSIM